MQAYIDKNTNRIVAYNREEIENCYSTLIEAVKNYGEFYLGEYALYLNDIQLLIFKVKQTIGIRMKELKNYTGDNKKELQELHHSSLVDIRNIEYLYEQLYKYIYVYAFDDTINKLLDIPKSKTNNVASHRLIREFNKVCTLKDGCDHELRNPWVTTETEFRPENPDDYKNQNGEFYTITYKTYNCRICNGNVYEFVSEVVTPKLDWDVKLNEINQRSRSITKNASVRK